MNIERRLHKITMNYSFTAISLLVFSIVHLWGSSFEDNWTPLYEGIEYRTVTKNHGKVKIHEVKIDASNPKVEIFTTAPCKDGKHTKAEKTSTFLKREKAQVVISGTGSDTHNFWAAEGTLKSVDALAICNGKKYGSVKHENGAFVVLTDGTKKIITREELSIYKNRISMAVGGWPSWTGMDGLLIYDGKPCFSDNFSDDSKSARAALGLTRDEKYLYLVLVEGQSNQDSIFKDLVSGGISLKELTKVMDDLGCYRALNLIGEGFATVVVENILNHKSIVLNTLSDVSGERALGSHIGIKAPLIENKEQFKKFRALQEESAFFDVLRKSESALKAKYMDKDALKKLDNKVSPLSDVYEQFGVERYVDNGIDYKKVAGDQSFEKCFVGKEKFDFHCGDSKQYLKRVGSKVSENVLKLTDLKFVGKKAEGWTKGGIYMDSTKVVYFVKTAQSVKNEIIASRLMNLMVDKETVPVVKLLSDQPNMVASRMIRGFIMARDLDRGSKKVLGEVELSVALDFIGLIDRHQQNMGYVELDWQTVKASRVDYDYSFAYELDQESHDYKRGKDSRNLSQLNQTLAKYSVDKVTPVLEKIVAIPDEKIVMEIFQGWTILSQIGHSMSLQEGFDLASELIARKEAFKKALTRIKGKQKTEVAKKKEHKRRR